MSQYKGLLKLTTIYIVLGFLPMGINFLLLPVFSEKLTEAEYGILTLASLFVGVATIVIGLGLDGAFSRYYYQYYKKPKLVNALLSTLVLTIFFSASVLGIFLYFSGDWLFDLLLNNTLFTYSEYGIYIFFTTIATLINTVFLVYFRNEEKVLAFSVTSIAFFVFSITGILLGVLYFEEGAFGSIVGRFAGTVPLALVLLVYFLAKWKGLYFEFRFLKIMLHYTLPLIPYLLLLFLYNNIDKIMVEQSFGDDSLDQLGKYNLAFQIGTAIQILLYSIFNSLSPQVYKSLQSKEEGSFRYVLNLYKVFHMVVMVVIVLMIACSSLIFDVFIDEKFHDGIEYLGILSLIYIPQLYYVLYTITLFFNKLTRVLPYISLTALVVGIGLNLLLIPPFGLLGVCVATLGTKAAQFLATLYFLKRHNQLHNGFVQMKKQHFMSVTILVVYLVAFVAHNHPSFEGILSIDVVNALPIILFIIFSFSLFKKELKMTPLLFKKAS